MGKKITYNIGFNVDKSSLKTAQQELQKISNMTLKDAKLIDSSITIQEFKNIQQSAKELQQVLKNSFNEKLGTYNLKDLEKNIKNLKTPLDQVYNNMKKLGADGISAFRQMSAEILTANGNIKESSRLLESMGKTLGNTIKWSIASGIVNMFTGSVQKAWGYTQKLDESLNNIRIVTEKSNAEMEKFAKTANRAAKSLGASTTDYTNASLIYYQQGLSDKDVQARTKTTIKAANVTGQSAAEVSEQLTAVWNGYKVVAEEAELYVDKLAAVAASTAADLEELSDGMSKVASAANAMGVDMDQLTAQIATIVSVTRQDASVVGTALKTIYSRMADLKTDGIDEFGISLGEVSGNLKSVGIEVLDIDGNLRDMGTVIEEVAGKWNTWTRAQQQAVAQSIAGKRQFNNLLALFENWDMYESALSTSQDAEGTLQQQQEIDMDSLEGKLEQLGTAAEKVWDKLINTEGTKILVDIITVLVEGVAELVDGFGGLLGILTTIGPLLMQVFNAQLTQGTKTFAKNIGIVGGELFGINKKRAKNVANELGLVVKDDQAQQDMIAIREEELKYSRWLTEEEKERYELLIKERAEIGNRKNQLEKEKKILEERSQGMLGVGASDANFTNVYDNKKRTIDSLLFNASHPGARNDFDQFSGELFVPEEAKDLFNSEAKKGGFNSAKTLFSKSSAELETKFLTKSGTVRKNLVKNNDELADAITGLITVKKKEEQVFNAVDKVLDVNSVSYQNLKIAQQGFYNGTVTGKEYLEAMRKALKEAGIELDNLNGDLEENTAALKKNGKELQLHGQKVKENSANTKKANVGNLITDMVSAAAALIGIYSTLSNLTKDLASGTASFGDILSSVIGIAMSLIPVFIALNAAMGPWGVALAALVAVAVGAIAILTSLPKEKSAMDKFNETLERTKEAADATRKSLMEVRDSVSSLSDAMEDLQSKQIDLKSLISGSEEFKNQITEINDAVLAIVEKFPELGSALKFENGMFTFEEGALENYINKLKEKESFINKNLFSSQAAIYETENRGIQKFAKDNYNQFIEDNYDYQGSGKIRLIRDPNINSHGFLVDVKNEENRQNIESALKALNINGLMTIDSYSGENKLTVSAQDLYNLANEDRLLTETEIANLRNLQAAIENSESPMHKFIDTLIENSNAIDKNNAKVAELNESYQAMLAKENDITTKVGEQVYKSIAKSKNINDLTLSDQDRYLIDAGAYFAVSQYYDSMQKGHLDTDDDKTRWTEFGGAGEDIGWIGKNIDMPSDIRNINAALGELAKNAEMTITTKLSEDLEKEGLSLQEFLVKDDTIAVDGEKMSVQEFIDLATRKIHEKNNKDKGSATIAKYINAAEAAGYGEGAGIFAYLTGDTDKSKGENAFKAWNSVTLGELEHMLAHGVKYEGVNIDSNSGILNSFNSAWWTAAENAWVANGGDKTVLDDLLAEKVYTTGGLSSFSATDFGDFAKYYNSSIFTDEVLKNANETSLLLSLLKNDGATREKYLTQMGLSSSFGEDKTGVELRELAINMRKKELDYLTQASEVMERAFGTDRISKMEEINRLAKATADNDRDIFTALFENTVLDKEQMSQGGKFNYETFLNYLAKLAADDTESSNLYEEALVLKEAWETAQESAWSVVDAKFEEYNYQLEILDSVKDIVSKWKEFNYNIKNWSQGITGKNNTFTDNYAYLTSNFDMLVEHYLSRYQNKISSLSKDSFAYDSSYKDQLQYSEIQKELVTGAMSALEELVSIVENLFAAWSEGLKEIEKSYDTVLEKIKDFTTVINGLIGISSFSSAGGFEYNTLSTYYNNILQQNYNSYLYMEGKVRDLLEVYRDTLSRGREEAQKEAKQALINATTDLSSWAENQFSLIADRFSALTSAAIDSVVSTQKYKSLKELSLQWELEISKDDLYLDETNEQYALYELNRVFQKSIDETDSIYAQNKLMEKRVEIENKLAEIKRDQGKLSQYDLDRANALYDLTLKQIALEEAQQTANKMKLVRDANGNYTYQYVQDQDAIADAEAELAAAQNSLYNMEKDRKKELVDNFFSMWQEYSEKMQEALRTGNKDLQEEVYEYYLGSKGVLNMLKVQMGLLTGEDSQVSQLFQQASGMVMNFNVGNETLEEIFNASSNAILTLNTTVNTLLGEDGSLISVLNEITDENLNSAEATASAINNSDKINKMSNSLSLISNYMATIANFASNLENPLNNYLSDLANQALTNNTEATNTLTSAILDLADSLDNQTDLKFGAWEYGDKDGDGNNEWYRLDQEVG